MSTDAAIVRRWRRKLAFYKASEALWKTRHTYRRKRLALWDRRESYRHSKWQRYRDTKPEGHRLRSKWWDLYRQADEQADKWNGLSDQASRWLKRRRREADKARRVIARHKPAPIRERAYQEAVHLVGVMEEGGNNVGEMVEKIIREGGGLPGQAWCGWFMACVYKRAGASRTSWHWGAVRLMDDSPSLSRVEGKPYRGHIVRFTFDHTGMFVRDLGDEIETIEGNTGESGAVSDGDGGDGVYRKRRHKSLVADYLHYG